MRNYRGILFFMTACFLFVAASATVANAQGRRHREMAAPVYFADAYPEYILGQPNIYAGYESDTVVISPTRGKTPFHYAYWNQMYNENPTYGKSWDQNWTVFGENGYYGGEYWDGRRVRSGFPGYAGGYGEYGGGQLFGSDPFDNRAFGAFGGRGVVLGGRHRGAAVGDNGEYCNECEQNVRYESSEMTGAYQGHYIANFDSFCNEECERPLFPCLSRLWNHLTAKSCLGGGPCCFADPCFDPCFIDPCCDPCCDPCDGIVVDGCCGDGFVGSYDGWIEEPCCGQGSADTVVDSGMAVGDGAAVNAGTDPTPIESNTAPQRPALPDTQAPANPQFPVPGNKNNPLQIIPSQPSAVPATPAPGPAPSAPPAAPAENDKTTGYIRMTVPADSIVLINGYQTKMTGAERTFAARNLIEGQIYEFEIAVVAERNGKRVSETQTHTLVPGTTMDVAFELRDNTERKQVAMR